MSIRVGRSDPIIDFSKVETTCLQGNFVFKNKSLGRNGAFVNFYSPFLFSLSAGFIWIGWRIWKKIEETIRLFMQGFVTIQPPPIPCIEMSNFAGEIIYY